MNEFERWLTRRPAGRKPRKPIARTSRPRPIGAKAKREAPEYARVVLAHLTEFPRCQIGPRVTAAGFTVRCLGVATHVHHTRGRGRYKCDRSTFLSSCSGECHPQWVHVTNVAEAIDLGLLLPR